MSVIEHDAFRVENDLNQVLVDQLVILGPAELPLSNAQQLGGGDRFVVNTVINLDDYGAPLDIFTSVVRSKKILKVAASRLFPAETAVNKYLQLEIDYQSFNFPPSSLCSDWIQSRNLRVKLMRTKNKNNGFHDNDEWGGFGVGEFMCRLAVEPDQAIVRLHDLPGDQQNMATYRGNTEDSDYPVINLMEDYGGVMGNVQTEPPLKFDGLPFYPFLIWPGTLSVDEQPPVNGDLIRKSMYSMWCAPRGSVFSKSHNAWHALAFPAAASRSGRPNQRTGQCRFLLAGPVEKRGQPGEQ